jgi:integrase
MTSLAEAVTAVKGGRERELAAARLYIAKEYPSVVKALGLIDAECAAPRRPKGYSLVKRENKKRGFVYYVRYAHEGRMLPSKWNTGTNDLEEAKKFAAENKRRLVDRYLGLQGTRIHALFEEFYESGSAYLACEEKRNGALSEKRRKNYEAVMKHKFVPFLKEKKISGFGEISVRDLGDFQDRLLSGGMRPQSVNDNLKAVRKVFAYLGRKGIVRENPALNLRGIAVRQGDMNSRGCYELETVNGVFNTEWPDTTSYLLCLLIYTTGMRNGEIANIRMSDIAGSEGVRFIRIEKSKTASGSRRVPLHDFVYGKLAEHAREKSPDEPVFRADARQFAKACRDLGERLGADGAEQGAENITFYSGRHFWKTLMNSAGLGEDIEEIFMGHKVSGSVAKLYNHRDRQGRALLAKKARQVFSILDKRVFRGKKGAPQATGNQPPGVYPADKHRGRGGAGGAAPGELSQR